MTPDSNQPQDPTLTPPPPASAPVPTAPAAPVATESTRRSPGVKAVLVCTAIVGGIALLGSGGGAAVAATGSLFSANDLSDTVQTIGVDGIEGIDLDVDAGNMRIEFGDVDEAELTVTNGRGPAWKLDRDGGDLVVRSPDFAFGWWFGGWFGNEESAVLTLPAGLSESELDADLTLDAGSLDVIGDFGALDITVSAGALDVEGAATSLAIEMSAGRADVSLDGVQDADLGVSAGDLTVELTGTAPDTTTIDVSAGSLELTVPDEAYTITQDVSAGSLDARVDQSSGARRVIDVTLSAGGVTIRPGS
nr:DUF4097 family beta strand repeat-containing protein [uncultured Microbacterium sp.]